LKNILIIKIVEKLDIARSDLRFAARVAQNNGMNQPLTVGIMTFNEEKRIQGCLNSLDFLRRAVTDIHVVVVDNGSSDRTVE